MEDSDARAFIELLTAYKRLWIKHQTLKFAHEHPDSPNLTALEEHTFETAFDLFDPVFAALHDGQPLQDVLRAALQNL